MTDESESQSNIQSELISEIRGLYKLSISKEVADAFAATAKQLRNTTSQISGKVAGIAKALSEASQHLRQDLRVLAENGWVISYSATSILEVRKASLLFQQGGVEHGNKLLSDDVANRAETIISDVSESFPARRKILSKAFEAHVSGDYGLSVPVILAQADGIGISILKNSYFTRNSSQRKELEKTLKARFDWKGLNEFLSLILDDLPVTESTKSENFHDGDFNRHAILHGISVDYPSRINSLRAIAWLEFSAALEYLIEHDDEERAAEEGPD